MKTIYIDDLPKAAANADVDWAAIHRWYHEITRMPRQGIIATKETK